MAKLCGIMLSLPLTGRQRAAAEAVLRLGGAAVAARELGLTTDAVKAAVRGARTKLARTPEAETAAREACAARGLQWDDLRDLKRWRLQRDAALSLLDDRTRGRTALEQERSEV